MPAAPAARLPAAASCRKRAYGCLLQNEIAEIQRYQPVAAAGSLPATRACTQVHIPTKYQSEKVRIKKKKKKERDRNRLLPPEPRRCASVTSHAVARGYIPRVVQQRKRRSLPAEVLRNAFPANVAHARRPPLRSPRRHGS